MARVDAVEVEFVEELPEDLAGATLYVSMNYCLTAHLCLCGCGERIVNPLRPHRWALTYDGAVVSLAPSVGNSGIACKSHYWITKSKVRWLPPMADWQSERAFERDGWREVLPSAEPDQRARPERSGLLARIRRRLARVR